MRQLQPVIWSKGTFLSPQHLQTQERFIEDTARFYLDALGSPIAGFSHLQIDMQALDDGELSVVRAAGIFPDALVLDIPGSEQPPASRPLAECFREGQQSCTFYLGVPEYLHGRMNVSTGRSGISTRFVSSLQMVRDDNTGLQEKPIQVARKNLQILTEHENLTGSVLLGFARVLRSADGKFRLDATYIPPLVSVQAHPTMTRLLSGLVELMVTRSAQLAGSRRQRNQSLADFTAADIANFWLLYTVNSHLPGLRHCLQSEMTSPREVFDQLSALAGSLTTFSNSIDPRDLPTYNHEDLGTTFSELDRLIRIMLDTVVPKNFVSLPLRKVRDTIYGVIIDKDEYFDGLFYLAITSDLREVDLLDRAPRLLKVSGAQGLEGLVSRALSGVRLTHTPVPPRSIPVKMGHQYFELERYGQLWDEVRRVRNLAVYAPAELPGIEMELVIVLPQKD